MQFLQTTKLLDSACLNSNLYRNRVQNSSINLEDSKKGDSLNKSYNRTKRFEKGSFDSDVLNSSQSIKFQNSK